MSELSIKKNWILAAAISGATAVALGALGAHWLKGQMELGNVTASQHAGFETGVRYQTYHALAILAVAFLAAVQPHRSFVWTYRLFVAGTLLFSGSLYLLCLRDVLGAPWLRFLGPVTPLGGLCLIAGWIMLGVAVVRKTD